MPQYLGLKTINKNTAYIKKHGTTLMQLVHDTGVQCILHLLQKDENTDKPCMDARPMDQLLQALPNGVRREGFKLWASAFSPIRWDGDGRVHVMKEGAKTYTKCDPEGADTTPFWDFSQENKPNTIKPEALLAMVKREAARVAEANEKGEVLDKDGKVRYVIQGNVVEFKKYYEKASRDLESIPLPSSVVPEEQRTEAKPAAARSGKPSKKDGEGEGEELRSQSKTGTNG